MPGQLYRKFGVDTSGIGALVKSQESTNQAFKEAIGGIGSLLEEQEQKYAERNTLNMQAYLQDSLKKQGLGAPEVDTIGIQKKFGNLINMDRVNETVDETKKSMVQDAIDDASGLAGQAFEQSEDMANAGMAFKQSLLNAGMKDTDATRHAINWRKENMFRAEDVKIRDNKIIADAATEYFTMLRTSDINSEEGLNQLIAKAKPSLRARLQTDLTEKRELWTKLSSEDQAQVDLAYKRIDNRTAHQLAQIDLAIDQKKAAIQQIGGIPDGAFSIVDAEGARLGGVPEAIADHSSQGLFSSMANHIKGWVSNNDVHGSDAAAYLQDNAQWLMKEYDIPLRTATAITVQAYNDLAGKNDGVIDRREVKAHMANYANQEVLKQEETARLNLLEKNAIAQKEAIMDSTAQLKHDILSSEKRSRITGKAYDPADALNARFAEKLTKTVTEDASNTETKTPPETPPTTVEAALAEDAKARAGGTTTAATDDPVDPVVGSADDTSVPGRGLNVATMTVGDLFDRATAPVKESLAAKEERIRGLVGKAKGADDYVADIRGLSPDEQETALEEIQNKRGKVFTERIKKELAKAAPTGEEVRAGLTKDETPTKKEIDALGSVVTQRKKSINTGTNDPVSKATIKRLAGIPATQASARETAAKLREFPPEAAQAVIATLKQANPELAVLLEELMLGPQVGV